MKQPYSKPTIATGEIWLDQPIANICDANQDDMRSLMELGYFIETKACAPDFWVGDEPVQGTHDTICYHSNVIKAFLS